MKEIVNERGQTEIQTDEYAPLGPVRIASRRRRLREPEWILNIKADGSRELRVTQDGKLIHACEHTKSDS